MFSFQTLARYLQSQFDRGWRAKAVSLRAGKYGKFVHVLPLHRNPG